MIKSSISFRVAPVIIIAVLVGLMAAMLSSCVQTSSPASSSPETSQVIIAMNTGSEPEAGFDPLISWGAGEHVHEPLIQSTLITTDTDMRFKNDLATSYESSADGLEWTFTIRNDAYFTNGEHLSAHDVAFTINGIKSTPASEVDLSMVDRAVAIDDETVTIILNKPYNALLYTLAVVGIVPEHAYGEDYGSNPIGSGRYMLEQWDKGQQVILKANPNYYGPAPQIQRVVIVFMEEDAALAAARSGQVDIAYTSAIYSGQTINGYELIACESVDSRGISLPTNEPGSVKADGSNTYPSGNSVTADKTIRQAINYAVDRDTLVEQVLDGHGTPAYSVADKMPWASPDMVIQTDVSKAKEMLDDNGWEVGFDGIRSKEGVRASLELWYPSNDSVRQALASAFSNQMKEIGIEVLTRGASWSDIYPHQFSDPILWGWGSNSPSELYSLNYSEGSGNFADYKSAKLDAYFNQALAQQNIEDSFAYWQSGQWDGQEGIAPQGAATWVWLVNIDHLYFKRADLNIADQKLHPHGHGWSLVNNVDAWSWD